MKLLFKLVDGSEKNFSVEEKKVVIGRSKKCNVVIPFDGFSRQHCLIEVDNGEIYITDLNSSNGVFINDTKIAAQKRVPYKTFLPLAIGGAFAVQIELDVPKDRTRSLVNLLNLKTNEVITTPKKSTPVNNVVKLETASKKVPAKKSAVKTDWLKIFKQAMVLCTVSIVLLLIYNFKDRILNATNQDDEIYQLQYEAQMQSKGSDGSIKTSDF
jgi:pSer/pThr/pTyr-binding forkhead associated (FHA) protein